MKKIISLVLSIIMLFSITTGMTFTASANDSRVEKAVQLAIGIANDNSHGYSQKNRKGPDYDCSSLVYYSLATAGGFNLPSEWFHTSNMGTALINAGFKEITNINLSTSNGLKRGDILWKSGHTEIYIGSNQLVGSHSDYGNSKTGDQNGKEISVTDYYYKGANGSAWTKVYRYEPVIISDFNIIEVSPYGVKYTCRVNNPDKVVVQKAKTRFRKVGEGWKKVNESTFSPVKTGSFNVSRSFKTEENTKYEFCYGVCINGYYYYSEIYTITTPAKTSIAGTSVPNAKVKYTGSNISTASLLNVNVGGKKLAAGNDYTVSPSTVKDIGKHKVTITGKNWYKDSATAYVTVYPKTPTVNSVTYNRTTNRISVKWARVAVCDYQQVAISTSPNFEPSKTCIYRVDQNKQSASFCKITFNGTQTTIKKGKTYYVRMRAYKTVNGTRIYGAYGAKKAIKCN